MLKSLGHLIARWAVALFFCAPLIPPLSRAEESATPGEALLWKNPAQPLDAR
jgi:hypothetical protein